MSAYHQIFARRPRPPQQLVSDVAAAIGGPLAPVGGQASEGIAYAGQAGRAAVEIEMSHEFEDDRGIPFSQYPIVITVRDYDSDKGREETVAREIFAALCGREYSLLLVLDLQQVLDTCGE
jgi:hypothetical protein